MFSLSLCSLQLELANAIFLKAKLKCEFYTHFKQWPILPIKIQVDNEASHWFILMIHDPRQILQV
jgi:hypothetical protein